jgi:hypothetical protein
LVAAAEFKNDDRPGLDVVITERVPQTQPYRARVGDRDELRERAVLVPVMRMWRLTLDDNLRVFTHDGKRVQPREIPRLFATKTPILLSVDGKEIDAFYLRLLREGTLVVVSINVPFSRHLPANLRWCPENVADLQKALFSGSWRSADFSAPKAQP